MLSSLRCPRQPFLRRHYRTVLLCLIAVLTVLAWTNRFVQDDAFISFRYARHLAEGHGLVWNVGEPVEGYTNFLWVLLVALALKLGLEPVLASQAMGLLLFAGTLAVAARLIRMVVEPAEAALIGVLVLGTNFTFSIYATGGLETMLQAFLCILVVYVASAAVARGSWNLNELLGLSLAMAAALLTRLDSAIVCAVAGLWCLAEWRGTAPRTAARRAALLLLPALLIVGTWLTWKLSYYGDILPNTFRLKGSFAEFGRGIAYVHRFLASYLLYPLLIFVLGSSVRLLRDASNTLRMLLATIAAWSAYVISVGGDFMEFRLLVPVLVLAVAPAAWLLAGAHRVVSILAVVLVAFGSLHHATTFHYDSPLEVESRAMLEAHLFGAQEKWVRIGQALGEAFGHDPEVRIAVTAAGAIPYYSELTTIDMLGLSDRYVAAHGLALGTRPGHTRIAPLSYLRARNVHIAISNPTLVPLASPIFVAPVLPRPDDEPLPDTPLIEIPIDAASKLIVWYLTPSPKVDAAIARFHWRVSRFEGDAPASSTTEDGSTVSAPSFGAAIGQPRP